jgi:GNAT superfamily N-acetyltransferase
MLRTASAEDVVALRDLEREANLIALAHVYPPERFPYPDNEVLARWHIVLDDPDCTTIVIDAPQPPDQPLTGLLTGQLMGPLIGLVTVDAASIRHLAVHPQHWGTGIARQLLNAACEQVDGPIRLWCLVDNHGARGLYEHLGWRPTGNEEPAVFPPHPQQMEYQLVRV